MLELSAVDSECSKYWIGFLITDGSVHENGTLFVKLQAADREHLGKLRGYLGSGARILDGVGNPTSYAPGNPFVKLAVYSKSLVESVGEFGVLPRKTPNANLLRWQFSRHTWRGAIDGDGTLGRHKRGYAHIRLYGSKALCSQFREFVLTLVPKCRAEVRRAGPMYSFGVCCGPAERVIRNWDCTVALDRKHAIARMLIDDLTDGDR